MKRATAFMVEEVSTNGGYVWAYLPDRSRRWGELEARATQIWIQPPGTPTMGHLFLDALHATGDPYYYHAAEQVAGALIAGQHPSGGWDYFVDFAGPRSRAEWYETMGRNAWRMEEFQHDWGNATFDDSGTADSTRFLLRLYLERRDPRYRPALDRAIQFVLESQFPIGAWPQRFPAAADVPPNMPVYPNYLTFNDDVAVENIDVLIAYYQTLGGPHVLDAIRRGMYAFLATQHGAPQPGWALQYTPDLKPAAARTYEPAALSTHTTARNIEMLLRFYRLTGDTRFLARIPEALSWLGRHRLPPGVAPEGRTHPTFIEVGTDQPLYVHRQGSNVVNGRYYVDRNPRGTIAHYSSFRHVDVAALGKQYEEARALPPSLVTKGSPLVPAAGLLMLPRYVAVTPAAPGESAGEVMAALDARGCWLAPLEFNSHPYRGPGSTTVTPGDFSQTHVGDDRDTSPFPDSTLTGISTKTYIRNMSVLIRYLDAARRP